MLISPLRKLRKAEIGGVIFPVTYKMKADCLSPLPQAVSALPGPHPTASVTVCAPAAPNYYVLAFS